MRSAHRSGLLLSMCFRTMGVVVAALAIGCTTGQGEGEVHSDQLLMTGCWNGPFDLEPTFFSAQGFDEKSLMIRVQRGDDIAEFSDGLQLVVYDLPRARAALGQDLPVGLPNGVTPPGAARMLGETPLVSLALSLHSSCRGSNGAVYSISGSVQFTKLFSGDPNEKDADERLTAGSFVADFADPRELVADPESAGARISSVRGRFEFFFQRGQPAQPFP
ncbi:MAG: hypothetical protein SFV15_21265 [Polyangiaceae bacterium]|nr:hypothetical protein [Polyangiaceae bacterium]